MTTKTTHIDRVKEQQALVKLQVQNLLGWDDQQYGEFQFQKGREYLTPLAPLKGGLEKSRAFWGWWRMQWMQRDELFLEISTMLLKREYESYYRELHEVSEEDLRCPVKVIL